MSNAQINDVEFDQIRRFFAAESGIRLNDSKRSLVCGRLGGRLRKLQLASFHDYMMYIQHPSHQVERQLAIDLLTTNETYFFREPRHFEFLAQLAAKDWSAKPLRVWSAACSSGEEPYSIAMVLSEHLHANQWQLVASDLSSRMLASAKQALYPLQRARELPTALLKKYCLKGVGEYDGYLLVDEQLQQRVHFMQLNLMQPLPEVGSFDVIFLRNVLIYFDQAGKKQIVSQLLTRLKVGGYLLVGHSESLHGVVDGLQLLQPAVYQKMALS